MYHIKLKEQKLKMSFFFLPKNNTHLLTDLFQIQLQEATAMTAHPSAVAQQPAQDNSCLNYCFPP
jgi:hypothetical protein